MAYRCCWSRTVDGLLQLQVAKEGLGSARAAEPQPADQAVRVNLSYDLLRGLMNVDKLACNQTWPADGEYASIQTTSHGDDDGVIGEFGC